MGYFDKTIEFILNTPIEELEKKMREYGVKFVENPHLEKAKEDYFVVYCRNVYKCL